MIGALLAGGAGNRMGDRPKVAVALAGRPLAARPLEVLASVCGTVAVVCKADTDLAALPHGIERWDEPAEPRHPLAGIAYAVERARGEVLVCAADMPFVDAAVCRSLIEVAKQEPDARAVVAEAGGRLEPLLAVYRPAALTALRAASDDARATVVAEGLSPVRLPVRADAVRSVNTPEELAAANAELAG